MVVWQALDALSHQFELCEIDAATRVVVVTSEDTSPDQRATIRAAVARSGADSVEVRAIHSDPSVAVSELLVEIVAQADVVITTEMLSNVELDDAQSLLFLAGAAPDAFPPHATMARRVRSLARCLRGGSALAVSDPHGTDLRIRLNASAIGSDDGIFTSRQPRRSFPAGWVTSVPARSTVNGELILMPGDTTIARQRFVSSPVRLTIVDDHVSAIEGDNPDADILRAIFEYAAQPSAYGTAQLSIGLNPGRAKAVAYDERLLDAHLARLLAGVLTISFGENLVADRPCDSTIMLALPGRTVHVDDLPIMLNGRLQGDFAPDVYETG